MAEAELINKVAGVLNVKPGKLEFNDEQVIEEYQPLALRTFHATKT
jgi:hypothetical protein